MTTTPAMRKSNKTMTRKVRESLAKPQGVYLLARNNPRPSVVHQAVMHLRREGYAIETRRHPKGVRYVTVEVPRSDDVATNPRRKHPVGTEVALPNGTDVMPHPGLGSPLRVTSLGEHPSGRVIVGLRDGDGRVWLTTIVNEDDL